MTEPPVLEMNTTPAPGQAMLYVRLSDIKGMSISDALTLLHQMGYRPQLRYLQWATDPSQVTLFALLQEATLEIGQTGHDLDLWDEYVVVCQRITPSKAVRYAWAEKEQPLMTPYEWV